MKRSFVRTLAIVTKALGVCSLAGICCFFILAAKTKSIADDLWKQLGLSQFEANTNINNSFLYGHFMYMGAKNARNVAAGNRIAVIRDLAAYAKKYIASDEFKRAYANYRDRAKPPEPLMIHFSADSIRAAEKERIEKAIKVTEANANSPNEKLRNSVPYRLENLRKELSALDDPNNKTIKQRLDDAQRSNDYAIKLYQDALKKFEIQFPADPRGLIRARLQEMLNITADVDYNAEVHEVNRWKMFVNPAYEAKPKEWKLAYRAGKPATDALRAVAGEWLKELK